MTKLAPSQGTDSNVGCLLRVETVYAYLYTTTSPEKVMTRSRGLGVLRPAMGVLLASAAACASGTQFAQRSSSGGAKADRASALTHWKQVRDSLAAQTLAESEGPRVSVQVN